MTPAPTLPPTALRVVIFGLTLRATEDDIRLLLGPWRDARLEILVVAGAADDAMAIVELPVMEHVVAWRLVHRLRDRRLHGRRLQPWVPAMSWRR